MTLTGQVFAENLPQQRILPSRFAAKGEQNEHDGGGGDGVA
jgi:hypothetical protein